MSEVLPGVDAAGGRKLCAGEGKIYFNARYYDPITGRFLTEDPSRKGVNWYSYCENNPINKTDPTGRDAGDPGSGYVAQMASGSRPSDICLSVAVKLNPTRIRASHCTCRRRDQRSSGGCTWRRGNRRRHFCGWEFPGLCQGSSREHLRLQAHDWH